MSRLYLFIAGFSALLLISTAPNDDNLDRLLARLGLNATANLNAFLDTFQYLPIEECYLVFWLDGIISNRTLSYFGYFPDLINDIYPSNINITDSPSSASSSINFVNLTESPPNISPTFINLTVSPSTSSSNFINLTVSPSSPANPIMVVGLNMPITDNDVSTSFYENNSLPLPRDIDIINALTWLNYSNTMHYAYSAPWIMRYVERPGFRSRLSSRSGAVNEELYSLVRSYCQRLIDHYGWQPYFYVSYDLSYHLLMQLSDQGNER